MKQYVITLCFLEGDFVTVLESDLDETQIKDKIDTHLKTVTYKTELYVTFESDSLGREQKLLVPSDTQSVIVEPLSEWIESNMLGCANYFKE